MTKHIQRKPKLAPAADAVPPIASTSTQEPPPAPRGKLGALVVLLRRADGAHLSELMAATGWQAHSVRGAIAGSLKKKLGLIITSEKSEAGRVYRIVAPAA